MIPSPHRRVGHSFSYDFIRESLALDAAHNKWVKACSVWDDDVLGVWPSSDFVLVEVLRVTKDSADGVGIAVEAAIGSVLTVVFTYFGEGAATVVPDESNVLGHDRL